MMKRYMVVGEKERQNCLYSVVRGCSEEMRAVRDRVMLAVCLPPGTRMTSMPGLLPIAISGSVRARVYVDIYDLCSHQGHWDAWSMGCHL